MRRLVTMMMCGTAFCLSNVVIPAFATDEGEAGAIAEDGQADTEIIVNARRTKENIQDVPQTIAAISGEQLEKLGLYQFDDISKLMSGVQLNRAGNIATVRGVSFNPVAQTTSSVSYYINEAPVQGAFMFNSIFDVGQFEILKGPQGTLRGQSAPSGAITLYSRKPDLSEFGGFVQATVTDEDARTLQGALNVPLISDIVGLRIAATADRTNNGGIRSANSTADPFQQTDAIRVSVRAKPVDGLDATFIYQQLKNDSLGFGSAVFGNGAPGNGAAGGNGTATGYNGRYLQTRGFNGPIIPIGTRLAAIENGDRTKAKQQLGSALIDYDFGGFKLSYVGGYSRNRGKPATTFGDVGNLLIGDYPGRSTDSKLRRYTHELRVATTEPLFDRVDLLLGVFDLTEKIRNLGNNGLSFQNGAFGTVLALPQNISPNLRFSTTSFFDIQSKTDERSFFANARIYITENTELSGGIRFIDYKKEGRRINSGSAGFRAVGFTNAAGTSAVTPITSSGTPTAGRTPVTAASCTTLGGTFGTTYTGVCDVPVAAVVSPAIVDKFNDTPTVYSATLSHKFTPDIMVYANYGTSFRPGPTQGSLVNGTNNALLASFQQLASESSTSYEGGVKASLFDNRMDVNIAVYSQKYNNLVFSDFRAIPYLSDNGQGVRFVSVQVPLNYNVDAKVKGFDFDMNLQPTDRWTVGTSISYSDGKFKDQLIPCNDGDFDGIAQARDPGDPGNFVTGVAGYTNAAVFIARCNASGRASATPKWSASVRTNYDQPINDRIDGFVSAYVSWQSKNPYANPAYTVPSYGLLNMNVGIRDSEAGWELQLFAKNLLNRDIVTAKSVTLNAAGAAVPLELVSGGAQPIFGNSGYSSISYTLPREFGLTFRYAFGSR